MAQINFSETHRGSAWNESHKHIDRTANPDKVSVPTYYPDHPVTRAVWSQYLNTVMAVDKKVGFVLELLRRDGLDRNTVVVFMADHGRAMPRAKQWPYDSGLHVPLIIYWPEDSSNLPPPAGYVRGKVSDQLVASIDVSATILDIAGVAKPQKMQGLVLLGPHREPAREYLFAGRDRGDETVFHVRTIRDQRFRYLRNKYPERPFLQINRYKEASYPIIGLMRHLHAAGQLSGPPARLMESSRPAEELYDLQRDPYETVNLADSAEYRQHKQRLAKVLDDWMDEIGDQGRTPEPPEVVEVWEKQMINNYDAGLRSRPADWFWTHPALGPYTKSK